MHRVSHPITLNIPLVKDTEPHPVKTAVLRILSAGRVILGALCHNPTNLRLVLKEKTSEIRLNIENLLYFINQTVANEWRINTDCVTSAVTSIRFSVNGI